MEKKKIQKMLLYFRNNHQPPAFGGTYQRRTFRELQKYNLIRVNSEGKVVITENGEEALETGVIKYLRAIEFEEELAKEAPRLKRERKLLLGIIFLLLICLLFLLLNDDDFTLNFMNDIV